MSKLARLIYTIVGMVVVAGVIGTVSSASQPTVAVPPMVIERPKPEVHIYTVDELLTEANRLRAEKGVAPLAIDERLNQSAQWKADDMKAFSYFGHVRDEYHGYMKAYELTGGKGAVCIQASENLDGTYFGQSPFDGEGWVSSKPHYEALINPRYESTGFGVAKQGHQMVYVQHFCDLR